MRLGERLRLVRGGETQKAFAAALGVHENTVANAERRDSTTQDYLLRLAEVRHINLHWLLTGQGAMRLDEPAGSWLHEKLALALADAPTAHDPAKLAGAIEAVSRCRSRIR